MNSPQVLNPDGLDIANGLVDPAVSQQSREHVQVASVDKVCTGHRVANGVGRAAHPCNPEARAEPLQTQLKANGVGDQTRGLL
jgi:hypothetical protein